MTTGLINCPEHVAAAYLSLPDSLLKQLTELRSLIIRTHATTDRAGTLVEDLRWGQPSYLTQNPVTGSTIRVGVSKSGHCALFFHCQSRLIETFRKQYGPVFEFEGNRALVLKSSVRTTKTELAHCIEQALTYKLTQRVLAN